MIPELGHFALILGLCCALIQSIVPLIGTFQKQPQLIAIAIPAARLQFFSLLIALLALTYAFVTQDFSVWYVAQNSNLALPMQYRISAVWGAHEGSLLLWGFILSGWTLAVTYTSKSLPNDFTARVLAVLGIISVGFLLFLLCTSNPFARLFPIPLDGHDLNPVLQDPGLIVHPPMLYMGYVGLAVPFAFAIAGLLEGRIDVAWTRWVRPWTTIAWVFLTAGITLGSWWAYYELGWGGWWFWDPVENASFMPWLVATALIHSLAVTEQRGAFKAWTVLLSILGFSLSLLGTFLVRSGVLVSVHAFATDPARGIFILIFLAIIIGSALTLFAWRAAAVAGGGKFDFFSRETFLLINNVLLVVACGSILMGTLYPLFLDGLNLGKISVGPPYFNKVFVPLMLPLVFILGFGPMLNWKKDNAQRIVKRLWATAVLSLILSTAFIALLFNLKSVSVILAIALAFWVMLSVIQNLLPRFKNKQAFLKNLVRLPRSVIGMNLAHFGIGVFIIGVTLTTVYSIEKDVRLAPGDSQTLANYSFEFKGVKSHKGPNYNAQRGTINVYKNDKFVTSLHPEKRVYLKQGNPMTEAGIDAGLTRDVYVSLGEPLGNDAWAVRLYFKPFVRWIWLGGLFMMLGGLFAATDKRYRIRQSAIETKI